MDKHYYTVKMRVDDVADTGEFDGYASVFNTYIESYNEMVDPGAYAQTLNHNGGHVPILYLHDDGLFSGRPPIGMGLSAREDLHGLAVRGGLSIDTHQIAKETWGFMRASQKVDRPVGLSVGFRPVQVDVVDGINHVKEAQLFEYSITPPDWQACPGADVVSMHSSFKRAQARWVVQLLTELGVTIPNQSRLNELLIDNSSGRGGTDVDDNAPALEAEETTQDATGLDEAQLLHSLSMTLSQTVERMRSH